MATFTFYIRDERYRVPTLAIVVEESEARARALAAERLSESAHHIAIDVYEGDALRFSLSPAGAGRPLH